MADAAAEPRPWLRGRRLAAAFGLLLAAVVGLSVWAGFLVRDTNASATRDDDIEEVQRIASRSAVNYMSISYRSFDRDYQRFMADMDAKMKQQASQGSAQVKQAVQKNQLVSSAVVRWVGTTSIGKDSAQVAVTVDRTAQSTQVKSPVQSFGRFQVQLTKRHGRWLVSDMRPVQ